MSLSYASNSASLVAHTSLKQTDQKLSKTFERLSSGLRINKASDDPAGLVLADSLHNDAIVAGAAIRNTNDGISMTSIMEGALNEIGNILSRMSELATESANGIYTNTQRSALSYEFVALGSEIERIAATTTFNDINLLKNSRDVTLQVGLDETTNSQITITGIQGTLQALGIGDAGGALTKSIIWTSEVGSQGAAIYYRQ